MVRLSPSAQSWKELLLDLHAGVSETDELARRHTPWASHGAMRGLRRTRVQRCWVHKTANVPNQMPKSLQPKPRAICTLSGWPRLGPTPSRLRLLHRSLRRKMPQGRRAPGRSGTPAEQRDFPAEHWKQVALEMHLRHGAPEDREDQGVPEPQDGARHGLRPDLECQAEMAEAGRIKSTRRTREGSVQGRNRMPNTPPVAPHQSFGHSSRNLVRGAFFSTPCLKLPFPGHSKYLYYRAAQQSFWSSNFQRQDFHPQGDNFSPDSGDR